MYESPSYPGARNNDPNADAALPTRDLSIINQPAGFIEFNNTEGFETVSFVHKTGAMFQMNNMFSGIFAPRAHKTHIMGDSFQQHNGKVTIQTDKGMDMVQLGDSYEKAGNIANWQEHSENYLSALKPVHEKKRLFELRRVSYKNPIDQSEKQTKEGKLAKCPSEDYKTIILYTAVPTLFVPAERTACDRTIFTFEPPEELLEMKSSGGGRIFDGWYCLTCWGTGESPSSQDGEWEKEKIKDEIEKEYVDLTDSLVNIEKNFGQSNQTDGGSKIVATGQSRIETIGTSMNTLESFRVDPVGKLVPYGIKIDPFGSGVYMQYRESPLIEAVHVDPGIGGDLIQTICDRWNVNVGANGISFKTNGQFSLFGTIFNILGENITIHSRNEISLGAERVDIEGEIITLRPKSVQRKIEDSSGNYRNLPANGKDETEAERHVLIDGNINVAQNAIIKGGAHIEGELSIHHITAPMEYQITETDFEFEEAVDCSSPAKVATKGDIVEGIIIGKVVGTDVVSVCAENAVLVHPHCHYFKNIPLKLFREAAVFEVTVGSTTEEKELLPHDAVRAIGARNNFDQTVLAKPVQHSDTYDTVLEKFGGACGESLVVSNGEWGENSIDSTVLPEGNGIASKSNRSTIKKHSEVPKQEQTIIGYYDKNKKATENAYKETTDLRVYPKGLA